MRFRVLGFLALAVAGSLCTGSADAQSVGTQWTGCYIGGNVGHARSEMDALSRDGFWAFPYGEPLGSLNVSGSIWGVQGGCDYQFHRVVIGLQGGIDGGNVQGQPHIPYNPNFVLGPDVRSITTFTARLGYEVSPALLFYLRGGVAVVKEQINSANLITSASSNVRWNGSLIGVGFEYLLRPEISLFAEYNYIDVGSHLVEIANGPMVELDQKIQTAKVGFNFRFLTGGR
ncbi:MAG: porin family protein [Xanthobacteraceae bacterium]|nr:porin family protein [Xanthobacteraceae bacterium]